MQGGRYLCKAGGEVVALSLWTGKRPSRRLCSPTLSVPVGTTAKWMALAMVRQPASPVAKLNQTHRSNGLYLEFTSPPVIPAVYGVLKPVLHGAIVDQQYDQGQKT